MGENSSAWDVSFLPLMYPNLTKVVKLIDQPNTPDLVDAKIGVLESSGNSAFLGVLDIQAERLELSEVTQYYKNAANWDEVVGRRDIGMLSDFLEWIFKK